MAPGWLGNVCGTRKKFLMDVETHRTVGHDCNPLAVQLGEHETVVACRASMIEKWMTAANSTTSGKVPTAALLFCIKPRLWHSDFLA
jgi:hypothetical protein